MSNCKKFQEYLSILHIYNLYLFFSLDKREKILKTCSMNAAAMNTTSSPKATTKKKIPKSNKGKDSGTSSEEERWLDAIESGKLEEVCISLNIFCMNMKAIMYNNYYV